MRPEPAHPVQEDFDFVILFNIILFILYTAGTFLKVIIFVFFSNFEVLHFLCLVLDFCHFLSPMMFVVSMYLILISLLASCT